MSAATVNRHIALVCEYLHRPVPGGLAAKPAKKAAAPKKPSVPKQKKVLKELLTLKGMTPKVARAFADAGIVRTGDLLGADPSNVAGRTGTDRALVNDFQKQLKKRQEIIQI